MEETFLLVKNERDELIKRNNRDSTDGGKARDSTMTDEISSLKIELNRQKKAYEAQFIEYVSKTCPKYTLPHLGMNPITNCTFCSVVD